MNHSDSVTGRDHAYLLSFHISTRQKVFHLVSCNSKVGINNTVLVPVYKLHPSLIFTQFKILSFISFFLISFFSSLKKKKQDHNFWILREKQCSQQLLVATMASLSASLGSLSSCLSPKSNICFLLWSLLSLLRSPEFIWLVSLSPFVLKNGRSWQEKEGGEEEKEIIWVQEPWWRRTGCGEI